MVRETWVQSQVVSYQRLQKLYLIPPCLTLSNIRCLLRVKWSKLGKGIAPSPTPWCSSYWKGSLLVTLNNGRQLYLLTYPYLKWGRYCFSYVISGWKLTLNLLLASCPNTAEEGEPILYSNTNPKARKRFGNQYNFDSLYQLISVNFPWIRGNYHWSL